MIYYTQLLDKISTSILGVLGDYSLNVVLRVMMCMVMVAAIVLLIIKVATFSRINNMLLEIYKGQLGFRAQAIFLIFVVYKLYIYLDIFVDSEFTVAYSFAFLSMTLQRWLKDVFVNMKSILLTFTKTVLEKIVGGIQAVVKTKIGFVLFIMVMFVSYIFHILLVQAISLFMIHKNRIGSIVLFIINVCLMCVRVYLSIDLNTLSDVELIIDEVEQPQSENVEKIETVKGSKCVVPPKEDVGEACLIMAKLVAEGVVWNCVFFGVIIVGFSIGCSDPIVASYVGVACDHIFAMLGASDEWERIKFENSHPNAASAA